MIATRSQSGLPLEDIRSDYDMAKRNSRFRRRRTGVGTVGTTGDYHYANETDFLYTIEYARDLDRNDPIAGMILDRLIDNILQDTGITPDPNTGDENLDVALKARWKEWATNEDACDVAGEHSFADIERLVLRAVLCDGDHITLPNVDGGLELIEAHRLRTPKNTRRNVVHGILLSEERKRVEYWFTKDEIDPCKSLARVADVTPVSARDEDGHRQVFHVFNPDRFSQTRGVSAFRRCADALGMHDDIQFANLVRQQIASCFAFIRAQAEVGKGPPTPGNIQFGTRRVDGGRTIEGISPGMQIRTDAGETITGFSPNIPNPQFFEHVQLVLKIVSANLNLPLHAVLLDASQTNFSGWRGAVDQARSGFRRIQGWFIRKFHQRIYEWKIRTWLNEDAELKAWASQSGVDPFKVDWNRPTWEYIEPLKDTNADIAKVGGMICSLRTVHARRGNDFDDVVTEIINDNASIVRRARDAARELNSEAESEDEKVAWRELLAMPLHKGLKASLAIADQAATTGGSADE